jgi:hypothetical protein
VRSGTTSHSAALVVAISRPAPTRCSSQRRRSRTRTHGYHPSETSMAMATATSSSTRRRRSTPRSSGWCAAPRRGCRASSRSPTSWTRGSRVPSRARRPVVRAPRSATSMATAAMTSPSPTAGAAGGFPAASPGCITCSMAARQVGAGDALRPDARVRLHPTRSPGKRAPRRRPDRRRSRGRPGRRAYARTGRSGARCAGSRDRACLRAVAAVRKEAMSGPGGFTVPPGWRDRWGWP